MIAIKDGSVEIIREKTKMRPIKAGDIVTVVMARADCFDFQAAAEIYRATVLWSPAQPGDLWYFRIGALEFAVNPCASDFVGLILEEASEGAVSPPTRWMDWPGRHTVRIIGGDGD